MKATTRMAASHRGWGLSTGRATPVAIEMAIARQHLRELKSGLRSVVRRLHATRFVQCKGGP